MTTQKSYSKKTKNTIRELRGQLLGWYDAHARELPWRAKQGQAPNPYHTWLSEIMLQQTTVQAVKAYYMKFLEKWPTIHDLAAADSEDVMAAWAGLGYYARARNLHKCAKIVSNELGGEFPSEQGELKKLPGIGDYTSAAIAAIAYNQPATVVDGNVERVIARLFNVRQPLPASKTLLKELAHKFYIGFKARPGDLAQAFMDLGATICIPKAPRCSLCPLSQGCAAYQAGTQSDLPLKSPKKKRPQKHGYVYWIEDQHNNILLHRRPEEGLLGGMLALPTSEWIDKSESLRHISMIGGIDVELSRNFVEHTFTHFDLKLFLVKLEAENIKSIQSLLTDSAYQWQSGEAVHSQMPTVFSKAYKLLQTL